MDPRASRKSSILLGRIVGVMVYAGELEARPPAAPTTGPRGYARPRSDRDCRAGRQRRGGRCADSPRRRGQRAFLRLVRCGRDTIRLPHEAGPCHPQQRDCAGAGAGTQRWRINVNGGSTRPRGRPPSLPRGITVIRPWSISTRWTSAPSLQCRTERRQQPANPFAGATVKGTRNCSGRGCR
jgi:hypothetical protein